MEWFWLILGIFLYLVMWIVTAIIIIRVNYDDAMESTFMGLFWPIILPIMIVKYIVEEIDDSIG